MYQGEKKARKNQVLCPRSCICITATGDPSWDGSCDAHCAKAHTEALTIQERPGHHIQLENRKVLRYKLDARISVSSQKLHLLLIYAHLRMSVYKIFQTSKVSSHYLPSSKLRWFAYKIYGVGSVVSIHYITRWLRRPQCSLLYTLSCYSLYKCYLWLYITCTVHKESTPECVWSMKCHCMGEATPTRYKCAVLCPCRYVSAGIFCASTVCYCGVGK